MSDTELQPTQSEDVPQGMVYLVTQGDYSSYEVVAAFTSRALADEWMATWKDCISHSADIEEYPLNPAIREMRQGYTLFDVTMWKDGTVRSVSPSQGIPDAVNAFGLIRLRDGSKKHLLSATVFTRDESHAIKITNDKRAEMIASGQWPEEPA